MKKILGIILLIGNVAIAQDSTKQQTPNPLTLSAFVEAYYSYDFNKPADNNKAPFIYSHNRHNEFNVNLAYIKAAYSGDRVRGNVALGVGTYMNANYSAEQGVLKNVYEADAGYKLSKKDNLWFDIGILPSHIGFESAHAPDCWVLTRSLLAENSPFFEGGAKLSYTTKNNKWLISAMALNGWQRITRIPGNSLMSWGTQIQYIPSSKVTINYSTFLGSDQPDSTRQWRYFHNLFAILQPTSKLGFILGFDIGQQQKAKGSSDLNTWFSPVVICRITPNPKWAFAVRGEYYSDENGVMIPTGTPNGFKTFGVSANIDYLPEKNILFRLEGRTLQSKDNIFVKGTDMVSNDSFITFSTSFSF